MQAGGEEGRDDRFDRADFNALREEGKSRQELKEFAGRMNRDEQTGFSQGLGGYAAAAKARGDISRFDARDIGTSTANNFTHNDIKALKAQDFSNKEIGSYLQDAEGKMGAAAQRLKDKYMDEITGGNVGNTVNNTIKQTQTKTNIAENTGDINVGGDSFGTNNTGVIDDSINMQSNKLLKGGQGAVPSTPEAMADDLKNKYVNKIVQDQSSANAARDTGTIGIGGDSYGLNNTGVIDYSVNLQSSGGPAGSGGSSGLTNAQTAALYSGLNENAYERSRSKMTGLGGAAEAINFATKQVGAADRVKGIDTALGMLTDSYKNRADAQEIAVFGDFRSPYYQPPQWNPPKDPKKIEVEYEGE